jgi:hypothetical protein
VDEQDWLVPLRGELSALLELQLPGWPDLELIQVQEGEWLGVEFGFNAFLVCARALTITAAAAAAAAAGLNDVIAGHSRAGITAGRRSGARHSCSCAPPCAAAAEAGARCCGGALAGAWSA